MALSLIWTGLVVISLLFGGLTGRLDAVSAAALDGAKSAAELCVSMSGALLFWNGVMELMRTAGISDAFARAFRPVLRGLFPDAGRDPETLSAISANVAANLLGLGNAATPLGIRAVERMAGSASEGVASDELCRFVVLNTASLQLFPATVASLRSAAGCSAPLDILPAVWLTSSVSVCVGLLSERLFSRLGTSKRGASGQDGAFNADASRRREMSKRDQTSKRYAVAKGDAL